MISGNLTRTPAHWVSYRAVSLLSTFVPLYQFFFDSADADLNSVEGPSPPIVRFFLQPWAAVRFGIGFAFFWCLLPLLYLGFKRARAWFIWTLLVPLLIFTACMGADNSGLLKNGLHAWFLTLVIFSLVIWKKYASGHQMFW